MSKDRGQPLTDDGLNAVRVAITRGTWDPVSRLWITRLIDTVDAERFEAKKWRELAESLLLVDPGLTPEEFKARYIDNYNDSAETARQMIEDVTVEHAKAEQGGGFRP